MKNKKVVINLSVAIISIILISVIVYLKNSNLTIINFSIKKDIPMYMKENQPKTKEDKERANGLIKSLEEVYNTNFTLIGVAYVESSFGNGTPIDIVSTVYAYSDEYPDLYISSNSNYFEEVNAYKFQKKIYTKAKELGINPSLITVDVDKFGDYSDNIFIEMFANKKIKIDSIKELFNELLQSSEKKQIKIHLYTTDKGSKKKYEEFLRTYVTINDNYIKRYFGNYEHKEIIVTKDNITIN